MSFPSFPANKTFLFADSTWKVADMTRGHAFNTNHNWFLGGGGGGGKY